MRTPELDENGEPLLVEAQGDQAAPTADDYKNVTASDPSGEEAASDPPQ